MLRAMSRVIASALPVVLSALSATADPSTATDEIYGFGHAAAQRQLMLEQRFDTLIDANDLRNWLKRMSAEPNQVGSPHDKANAQFMLEQFRAWGWDARIETFEVLYPTPKKELVELVVPTQFRAQLAEPAIAGDATSSQTQGALPPYNVYGADGDVTAELVYANFGMPDDYRELERRGISVKGKIVIARYGQGWRGLKPKLAQEHGAIGCLIYSDPHEDGYGRGDVYPKGGFRPADGVQRGSVADMPVYPGDPLTPGVGATKDAKRLARADAKTLLKIPVLPISYADAQPLLAALEGQVVPEAWRGALPITYHYGPGPAQVHLLVESDWGLKPVYDVIATLRGNEEPDRWIIRGNHHDGWVFGAWDPLSGNVALMAEAKAIGALAKHGWKPKRTLVYASWDAEEPGLLGSTEWVETHAAELERKAVLYVNSDTNARGFLHLGGSHSLQHAINQVAAAIADPQTKVSVRERERALLQIEGYPELAKDEQKQLAKLAAQGGDLPIDALGSGSDFTPFLQHLGIATLSVEYGGEDDDAGIYHSAYDSFDHYVRFGDPDFSYSVTLAKTVGHMILRMADADVLPLRFGDVADTLSRYLEEIHKLLQTARERTLTLYRLLDNNAFQLAADPSKTHVSPERDSEVPALDFAPLDAAISRLNQAATKYDAAYARLARADFAIPAQQRAKIDAMLLGMERTLTDAHGLPGRDWYKHLIYAPGLYTGYGVKTLPGVREGIEGRRWDDVNRYIIITAKALDLYSERLNQAAAGLNP